MLIKNSTRTICKQVDVVFIHLYLYIFQKSIDSNMLMFPYA